MSSYFDQLTGRFRQVPVLTPGHRVQDDAYRCGHPRGGLSCQRLNPCHMCPFAELVDVEPAKAA